MIKARLFASPALCLALSMSGCLSSPGEPVEVHLAPAEDSFTTSQGDLVVHPIHHATFQMRWANKVVDVDPVGGTAPFEGLTTPDVIFATDIHTDHMNLATLAALVKTGTVIIAPQAVYDMMPGTLQAVTQVLANGDTTTVAGIGVQAIPMYNTTSERLQYHPKGRGNGYVLTVADKRVYIAGDTEDIPEMRQLHDIDVAFIPMNLPYTMTVEQAADAVREFKPKVVYPYHYDGSNPYAFARLVGTDVGVEVRNRYWY